MRPEEPVSRIMTETVVVIELDRPVSEAMDCFTQYPIHHLPVVRHGKAVGMLSSADVMKLDHFMPRTAADPAKYLDEHMSIEKLMHAPVISLAPHTSVTEAANRMEEAGVHAAPVVDGVDRVIGIVTTSDVIRGLLRGPPRIGVTAATGDMKHPAPAGDAAQVHYHQRPTAQEHATAMATAELLHVEARDPRFLGKVLLYLEQRNAFLEKVLELSDRFLRSGQDVHVHALLLKAVLAAKRAEEHATGQARVPFPLE
jgi:CBS domain-containing protein